MKVLILTPVKINPGDETDDRKQGAMLAYEPVSRTSGESYL